MATSLLEGFFWPQAHLSLCWGQARVSRSCASEQPDLCLMGLVAKHPLGRTLRPVLPSLPEVPAGIPPELRPAIICSLEHPGVAPFPSLPHISPPLLVLHAIPEQMDYVLAHLCLKVILRGEGGWRGDPSPSQGTSLVSEGARSWPQHLCPLHPSALPPS